MLAVAWKNRDNLSYAWKVLTQGVCDGCALGVSGFHDWTIDGTHLCMTRLNLLRINTMPAFPPQALARVEPLQALDNRQLREMGRLPCPLIRRKGDLGFQPISWEQALQELAERMKTIDASRMAFFLTSRGLTNETYYVAQKVARFLGTNNIDNAARLCHAPSTGAMKSALGVAASTCSYKDWMGTDLIVFFGANPANDQPVTTKYLLEARKKGTQVAMVNPYLEPGMARYWVPSNVRSALFGSDLVDYWFPLSQGGDIAFLYGVCKQLLEQDGLNHEFLNRHVSGWEQFQEQLRSRDWASLESFSGAPQSAMTAFAQLLHQSSNAVFVWSMGITQHVNGADAVAMILNTGLLRGYVGRPLNGFMPIRGHSGVQGGAEMGAYATAFPGGLPIHSENAKSLEDQYGFPIPDRPGLQAPHMVQAAADGKLDLLYCVGGNFLRTLPDPHAVRSATARIPLRVYQDILVTDQMLIDPADTVLLFPAKTRYEQDGGGTETTTERRVLFSPEIPRQVGEARAEWKILRDIAAAVHPDHAERLGCETGQAIREEIARVVPVYDGIQLLKKTGDQFQYGGERLCERGVFGTPDQKAHLRTIRLSETSLDKDEFRLSTRRGKQFNTLIYDETDPITGAGRRAVFINQTDAGRLGLHNGDPVLLINEHGEFRGEVFLVPIASGNLQVHWPEGNVLIAGGRSDPVGGVPDYNAIVRIRKLPAA